MLPSIKGLGRLMADSASMVRKDARHVATSLVCDILICRVVVELGDAACGGHCESMVGDLLLVGWHCKP